MSKVGLSSPWESYRNMVYTLFQNDPDINVQSTDVTDLGDGNKSFWIESQDSERLAALQSILKDTISLGNITLHIEFKYANGKGDFAFDPNMEETWQTAFKACPFFVKTVVERVSPASDTTFAIFGREVVSFYNDNISDYCMNSHKVCADIIKEIMNNNINVNPCTQAPAAPGTGGNN